MSYRGGRGSSPPRPTTLLAGEHRLTRTGLEPWLRYTATVRGDHLDVVRARDARALWNKAVQPVARSLGFKPGNVYVPGWVRESAQERSTFWFQIDRYGFDKWSGGQFWVEFIYNDLSRQASIRNRMWALLDDLSRRAVVHMNNDVIASLPGPSHEILMSLPELLRSTYLNLFKPITDMPPSGHDLGFRYATKADATAWGDFIASRLPSVDARSSGLLKTLDAGTSLMDGRAVKYVSG